jgi:hypothetical protein
MEGDGASRIGVARVILEHVDADVPLPMFPLSTVLFPGDELPLHVFETRYRALVDDCLAGEGEFGVVLISRGSEVGGGDVRVAVGTRAAIEQARRLPDGRWLLLARGVSRIRIGAWADDDPYPRALVVDDPDDAGAPGALLIEAGRVVRRARALASEMGADLREGSPSTPSADEDDGWRLCAQAPLGPLDRQRLLEAPGPAARLRLLVTLMEAACDDMARLLAGG